MLTKLILIGAVFAGFLLAFSSEIEEYFPNAVTASIASFKLVLSNLVVGSFELLDQRVDLSSLQITPELPALDGTLDSVDHTIQYAGNQIDTVGKQLDEDVNSIQENIEPLNPMNSDGT